MNNKILCSTGAFIGHENNFDYKLIPFYCKYLHCTSYELMMLPVWYPYIEDVTAYLKNSGTDFEVIHSDKNIGVLISKGIKEETTEALRLFENNCRMGFNIGARKIVLHLWGGLDSDIKISYNIEILDSLFKIADIYNIKIVIENIVCIKENPLIHWNNIHNRYNNAEFIFDTRFGSFHCQLDDFFNNSMLLNKSVSHIHISDFTGPSGDFTKLRPIPMPGYGIIGFWGFDRFFSSIKNLYSDSITLESPSINRDGSINTDIINNALDYIDASMNK